MPDADRRRWQARYAAGTDTPPTACAALRDNLHLLPRSGEALDLACGLGGNARLLAARGLRTHAWDIADNAIAALRANAPDGLHAETRDVVAEPPPAERFDVIVVSRFLDRPLCPAIAAALTVGGLLVCQTFMRDAVGEAGPRNPDYRLAPGELLRLFPTLRPLVYRDEGRHGDLDSGTRDEAHLVAVRDA